MDPGELQPQRHFVQGFRLCIGSEHVFKQYSLIVPIPESTLLEFLKVPVYFPYKDTTVTPRIPQNPATVEVPPIFPI